jgi:hypothetical protein
VESLGEKEMEGKENDGNGKVVGGVNAVVNGERTRDLSYEETEKDILVSFLLAFHSFLPYFCIYLLLLYFILVLFVIFYVSFLFFHNLVYSFYVLFLHYDISRCRSGSPSSGKRKWQAIGPTEYS